MKECLCLTKTCYLPSVFRVVLQSYTLDKNFNASAMFVDLLEGLNSNNSRIILNTWERPFLGGIKSSTSLVNKIKPILSLFWVAEKAKVAAISVRISLLNASKYYQNIIKM